MMCLHVTIKIGDLCEWSTAVGLDANERSLAGVYSPVIVEICDLGECFAAVDAKMRNRKELGRNVIKFTAASHSPHVRTIICVNAFMIAQVGLLWESLVTVIAHPFLLGRMIAYVIQERCLTIKHFMAERTFALLADEDLTLHTHQSLFERHRRLLKVKRDRERYYFIVEEMIRGQNWLVRMRRNVFLSTGVELQSANSTNKFSDFRLLYLLVISLSLMTV